MVDSSFRRAQTSRWVRHAGQLALILTFFALIFAVAWTARASILRGVADLWIVSDDTDKADAIVVLGGGLGARPFVAADLYKRGLAQQILIANVRPDPVAELKIVPPETDLTRQVLIRLGVPPAAIIEFGDDVSSTYEEARAILDWAKNSGAKSLIIPTEIFPARRVRWIFQHELAAADVRVTVQAHRPRGYGSEDWWRHEDGLITFQNEVIKFIYYRLKY